MLLVRHAQSVWNVAGRWQGHADPPLSKTGVEQARSASARIGPVDAVVSSDLERARRTAALLVPTQSATVEPDLREYDVGMWSGRTRTEIEAAWPVELALFDSGQLEAPPGAESRPDFQARVLGALSRLARGWSDSGLERVLVVSHGGVIRTVAQFHGWPETRVGQLSGYEAEVKADTLARVRPVDLLEGAAPVPQPRGEVVY
jgi:glucosyl-3-phosphoglycerate phosphatase